MKNHFYAMLSRMKNIYRWGLMRNTKTENLSEHSLEVAYIAHALGIIRNNRTGGSIDQNRLAVYAMFHDTSEIITGDMPTPVKYYNAEIKSVYKQIEKNAENSLLSMLPSYMKESIAEVYAIPEEYKKFIKAADKISAYIKCTEELKMGNTEFSVAAETVKHAISEMKLIEADIFMEEFIPSFSLSLDEQNLK